MTERVQPIPLLTQKIWDVKVWENRMSKLNMQQFLYHMNITIDTVNSTLESRRCHEDIRRKTREQVKSKRAKNIWDCLRLSRRRSALLIGVHGGVRLYSPTARRSAAAASAASDILRRQQQQQQQQQLIPCWAQQVYNCIAYGPTTGIAPRTFCWAKWRHAITKQDLDGASPCRPFWYRSSWPCCCSRRTSRPTSPRRPSKSCRCVTASPVAPLQ